MCSGCSHASALLYWTIDFCKKAKRITIRVLKMDGLATKSKRGLSLFRKLRLVLQRATYGNSRGFGEEWPEILVGGVRSPPKQTKEMDLDSLLPQGFLDRTKDRGLVVKNWAPQVEVLNHGSVGGFVTHCGWNSELESVCAGVPMVAWPLYAEQRFNRLVLVEEIKIALPMNESEDGFVSADEVEKRVTELMTSSDSSDSVRKRVLSMKDEARAALSNGGSSRVALTKFTESWNQKVETH